MLTTKGWSIYTPHNSVWVEFVDSRRAAHLLQQSALLNDVGDGLHLHTFGLVDILEGVKITGLLVLDDSDLRYRQKSSRVSV